MRVVFRVDGSDAIGSGHAMRCQTLADTLAAGGAKICFVVRSMPAYLVSQLTNKGYDCIRLTTPTGAHPDTDLQHSAWLGVSRRQDAQDTLAALDNMHSSDNARWNWLVVDHYGIAADWETALRPACERILAIDDLADRGHDCDALIDQNLHPDTANRYTQLVPDDCKLFLGPQFAFLRDEFLQARRSLQPRSGEVRNILIYFGGVDADNHTLEAIKALQATGRNDIAINVVIGAQHPDGANIQTICTQLGYQCHVQTGEMARLMAAADLAVGAGGISAYERLYLRLPSILRPIAANQIEQLECMAAAGLCELYRDAHELHDKLTAALNSRLAPPADCVADGRPQLAAFMRTQAVF